jgi:ribosomal-protein-alanine N-acetyltransferase
VLLYMNDSHRLGELEVNIRPLQLADLEAVQAIDQMSFSMPWPASAYRFELLENAASLLHVAEVRLPGGSSTVVSVIVTWLIMDEAHIATLAVHPDYRRRGISRLLVKAALGAAIEHGSVLATLEVRAGNQAAQALYRSFGFEIVGRRPRYYRDNQEDALIMTADFQRLARRGESFQAWLERVSPLA